jgi:hypothetical protein
MPNDNVPGIKMFGLQRTCTNVVLKGLKANFLVASREKGREWKHGRIGRSGDDVPIIVCCFREPLAWLASMYRWSFSGDKNGCPHFQTGWSFSEFLASPHYDWPTPLDRWNEMNRHYLDWLKANPTRGIAIRSEDMMSPEDARREYMRIGEKFGLRRRSTQLHVFKRRVNNSQALMRRPMDFDYYTERRYLAQYPEDVRSGVQRSVARDVAEQLGYAHFLQ